MSGKPEGKPSEAPLAHADVPEQDGSEDPGVGLELTRDAGGSAVPPSPSAAEHVNKRSSSRTDPDVRGGKQSPAQSPREEKTVTHGIGEGATVSHDPRK